MFPAKITSDWVGPRDPQSNMRSIQFYVPPNETALEKEYRLMKEDTQNWHHEFWATHNRNFSKVIHCKLFFWSIIFVHCFIYYCSSVFAS